ncbi:hypothetical protein FRB93_005994 [Tulasnella sp. JGI-2019a]|nr:hypothetical protein FRB93_005994 [Tulasnella sp. JGI-2019a]
MGAFIWNQWARFVSISASIYIIWAGIWGIFYRKFFWDFVGGVRMDTATQKGIIPGKNSAPFLAIIVAVPLIQILAMVLGSINLMVEYPVPFIKKTPLYRGWIFRIILLTFQSFVGILFYQGTNGAIWSAIAALAYVRAQMKGETIEEAKDNRGKAGVA